MPRKPAIFLFLLVCLSIGSAILFHQHRKDPRPTFAEVDAFLRQAPCPGGWQAVGRVGGGIGRDLSSGWKKWIGIQHVIHFEADYYRFHNTRTSQEATICVTRSDGEISRVEVMAGHPKDLKDHVFGKFPGLLPYDLNAKP